MQTITIKNIGHIKEVKEISLNKINVFIGLQNSGKSTIAKIVHFCTCIEKDVATSQSLFKYRENKKYFKECLESFYKIKGYFNPDSYIHYKSKVIEIIWKNEECSIFWVNQHAYRRNRIVYIPSERSMVILPKVRISEFENTYIGSFLFDWFEARKKYSNENRLSILGLGIDYYYIEECDENHIKGNDNITKYDILLSNASSGVQSITPLVVMIEHSTKCIYNENTISFEQEEIEEKIFVEEPEQNLSPENQRDLVYYFLQKCLDREENELTLTTYSPYVLYALNNCMMAGLISNKMSKMESNKLKCIQSKIDPSLVSIYEIRDGVLEKTVQSEDGLISDNYFDQKMKELFI